MLRQPWYQTFHDLMANRVREILLVSSHYDFFTLEEDGRLTERIFTEYSELNLTTAPRITHAATGADALRLLEDRRFDLVLTMVRLTDTDVSAFARKVKERHRALPVVLLVLSEADLNDLPGGIDRRAIDRAFVWTGDARILLAIIKLVEDALNVDSDTRKAGVRVIIVVEDSIRRYSSFLAQLYPELMQQSNSLVAEGVNDLHRLMRMRTRPKILLATDYEEAMALYHRFPEHLVAVITDCSFPRDGEEDPEAGIRLTEAIQADHPGLPILIETADRDKADRAASLGVHYLDKGSSTFLRRLRGFFTENLGFGEFIFRLPDRTEVGRARDMFQLEQQLGVVPAASVEYHASHDHFSLWLQARSMFALAEQIRPQKVDALGGPEAVRQYLRRSLRDERLRQQEGVIVDFSTQRSSDESHFVRLGKGSVGGKARGLAFVAALLAHRQLDRQFEGLRIRTPRSVAIATDEFDRFVDSNQILDGVQRGEDDRQMLARCLAARLPERLAQSLREAVAGMRGPLAVRSSSLLEDSQTQPFAGIYATYMLPNNHPNPEVRFQELCQAIKAVYASTYGEDARAYIQGTPFSIEEEKMAVLIQEMVGRSYGDRFYPAISGVGLSYNYYPVGHQKAEEGLVLAALGLGQTVVQGGTALAFSPATPTSLPQFGSPADFLRYSQAQFYALDLTRQTIDFASDESSLRRCDLGTAEADGTLALVGSVYSREDDVIRDDLRLPGPRLVTFNNVLKWEALPLAPALVEVLALCRDSLGCPVEIEFAVDRCRRAAVGDDGEAAVPCLQVLQIRPQATQFLDQTLAEPIEFAPDQVLCRTDRSLGHGVFETVRDVVYVPRRDLEARETPRVAEDVGLINARLAAEHAPYLLVGPGRWGSSDPQLGIPVKWSQIAGARLIIETGWLDRDVEPSQGAHFFHNMTSFRIGYLTLSQRGDRFLDAAWLDRLEPVEVVGEARHLRLPAPLRAFLDGRKGTALVLKPR